MRVGRNRQEGMLWSISMDTHCVLHQAQGSAVGVVRCPHDAGGAVHDDQMTDSLRVSRGQHETNLCSPHGSNEGRSLGADVWVPRTSSMSGDPMSSCRICG